MPMPAYACQFLPFLILIFDRILRANLVEKHFVIIHHLVSGHSVYTDYRLTC